MIVKGAPDHFMTHIFHELQDMIGNNFDHRKFVPVDEQLDRMGQIMNQ